MKNRLIIIVGLLIVAGFAAIVFSPQLFHGKNERKVLYWTDPMMPGFKSDKPGKSPMGMEMVPVYDSTNVAAMPATGNQESNIAYYTCAMHPQVREDHPGNCPICSMKLIPVKKTAKKQIKESIFITPEKQQLIGMKTALVEFRTLASTIRTSGKVEYAEPKLAVVSLRTSGWIQDLYVDFVGKYVRKGEPLFTLYSPELVSAQQEYLLAKNAQANQDSAWTIESAAGNDSSLLEISRERLNLWQLGNEEIKQLEKSGQPMTYVIIRSPLSGYVTEKNALKGMKVEPGASLYKIADLSTVWINADVYEYELPFVKIGQRAEVEFPYNTAKKSLTGKIMYVSPFLDPSARVQRARLEFSNPEQTLKPDMFVNVVLKMNIGRQLSVPRDAVLNSGTEQYVFIDNGDGYFEPRVVKISGETDTYYAIADGVKEGERVVTSANFLLDSESRLKGLIDQRDSTQQDDKL